MNEVLLMSNRKARKEHTCNYCGGVIKENEVYSYTKIKGDYLYDWKAHLKCEAVASGLWDFIDPDDGMTQDDFFDGCQEFCRTFVCPNCEHMDKESDECEIDETFCIDRIAKVLDDYDLVSRRDGIYRVWKLEERRKC